MTRLARMRPTLGGLRVRLVLAFIAVAAITAVFAVWASAASASNSLLEQAQDRITAKIQRQAAAVAPSLNYPPDEDSLDRLRTRIGGRAVVTYGSDESSGKDLDLLTPRLRSATADAGGVMIQRVDADNGPKLVIGTPLLITEVTGKQRPSGLEIYAVRDLDEVQQQIDSLTTRAVLTSALVVPIAVLLALLAAGTVLRPVRDLRTTARRLAAGDLGARLRPRGSDELAELAGTFNDTAASLEKSVGELARMEADSRRFVADVSHELRTPLSTLTAVAEVLESEAAGMTPDARESTRLAVTETRRLTELVEDLMEVSRFDAGAAMLHPEPVGLDSLIRDCLRSRGWLDHVELDASDDEAVLDPRRLGVVLANLVGNALRHGEPPVQVDASGDPTTLTITVRDHGPGLPDETMQHLFDRFYKADPARTRTAGSGLGMAIAAENAKLHGGTIDAGNAERGGAVFTVRIPRTPPEEP